MDALVQLEVRGERRLVARPPQAAVVSGRRSPANLPSPPSLLPPARLLLHLLNALSLAGAWLLVAASGQPSVGVSPAPTFNSFLAELGTSRPQSTSQLPPSSLTYIFETLDAEDDGAHTDEIIDNLCKRVPRDRIMFSRQVAYYLHCFFNFSVQLFFYLSRVAHSECSRPKIVRSMVWTLCDHTNSFVQGIEIVFA